MRTLVKEYEMIEAENHRKVYKVHIKKTGLKGAVPGNMGNAGMVFQGCRV